MPNHITNVIAIHGVSRNRLAEILRAIHMDEIKHRNSIDFEQIIPPPEGIYRGDVGQRETELYGENTLLDWSRKNWNTKWNSYGYNSPAFHNADNEIEFLTAWSKVDKIMERLSEMFPDAQFYYKWADEDIGAHVGEQIWQNGEVTEENIPENRTAEAYEMAAAIIPVDLEEMGYVYSEEDETYHYIEELDIENCSDEDEETVSIGDIHTSPDFQCDQTEGFPASLLYDKSNNKAWLELNESLVMDRDEMELNYYRQLCKDWGVHPCTSWEDYNNLLESIGEEAYENAAVPLDDADEEMGGMNLQ